MSSKQHPPLPSALAAYSAEIGAAIASSALVAPLIAIVDKAIFSNASGKEPLVASLVNSVKAFTSKPLVFLRGPSVLWIWLVYGGTYVVANCTETACTRNGRPWYFPKFLASSAANVSLSVTKDRAFSRMYGVVAPKPVPLTSMALFGTRDSMTILASFNLTTTLSTYLQKEHGVSRTVADTSTQLSVPLVMQLFSSPLHLLGMDLYNRPEATDRWAFIKREYAKTAAARMGRIFPAFGIGGVTNKALRKKAHKLLGNADDHH